MKRCSKCTDKLVARGLCRRHYQQWWKSNPNAKKQKHTSQKGKCSTKDCKSVSVTRGVCNPHYQRFRRYGSTDPIRNGANPLDIRKHTIRIGLLDRSFKVHSYAIVDIEDLEIIQRYKWRLQGGYVKGREWVDGKQSEKSIRLHRLLLTAPKELEVDHRDGNPLNNRRKNLKLATRSENAQNMVSTKGRYRGVTRHGNKWTVQVCINRKVHYLGIFSTSEVARKVAVKFRKKYMPGTNEKRVAKSKPRNT